MTPVADTTARKGKAAYPPIKAQHNPWRSYLAPCQLRKIAVSKGQEFGSKQNDFQLL